MRDGMRRQAANEEAENRWWRKTVTGEEQPSTDVEDDDMGNIMLGDVNHPAPVIFPPPQPQSNTLQTAVMAAALAAATGMGGYMLANRNETPTPDPKVVEFDYESVNIGLGRIEDYLQPNGK